MDTDAAGRIHFMFAFRFLEIGEEEAMRALGFPSADIGTVEDLDLPRVHAECDYLAPLFYDDVIDIATHCERVGEHSITWGFEITRDQTVCIRGRVVVAVVNRQTGKAAPVPQQWRALLEEA